MLITLSMIHQSKVLMWEVDAYMPLSTFRVTDLFWPILGVSDWCWFCWPISTMNI